MSQSFYIRIYLVSQLILFSLSCNDAVILNSSCEQPESNYPISSSNWSSLCVFDETIDGESRLFQFSGSTLKRTTFHNTTFRSRRGVSTSFANAVMQNVLFDFVAFTDPEEGGPFYSKVLFDNAKLTNVTFRNVLFESSVLLSFARSNLRNVSFEHVSIHGKATLSEGSMDDLTLYNVYVGPRVGEQSTEQTPFYINKTVISGLDVKNSEFLSPFKVSGTNISNWTSFQTTYNDFTCEPTIIENGPFPNPPTFRNASFVQAIFIGDFSCPGSSWYELSFSELVVFRRSVDFSHATISNFSLSQTFHDNAHALDMSYAILSNGSISELYAYNEAKFAHARLQNVDVQSIFTDNPTFFKSASFINSNTDTINGTCCTQFCAEYGCNCDVEVLQMSQTCLEAVPTSTSSVSASLTPSPSESSTVSPTATLSRTSSPTFSSTASATMSIIVMPSISASLSTFPEFDIGIEDPISTSCFPRSAKVRLISGDVQNMYQLRHGSRIAIGNGWFSDIFFFGHRQHNIIANYLAISHSGNNSPLVISPSHYLYVNGNLQTARTVAPGNHLRGENSEKLEIISVKEVKAKGMYAPTTLVGDLVVGGVVVSSYTDAIMPVVAHMMLLPVRVLYRVGLRNIVFGFNLFDEGQWLRTARRMGLAKGQNEYV